MFDSLFASVFNATRRNPRNWPIFFRIACLFSRTYQKKFLFLAFSMMGKMAHVDGLLDNREKEYFERFMNEELNLDTKDKTHVYQLLRQSRALPMTFEKLAEDYLHTFGSNRVMIEHLIGVLLDVAVSNDDYAPTQRQLIRSALKILRVTRSEYNRIKQIHLLSNSRRTDTGSAGIFNHSWKTRPKPEQKSEWKRPPSSLEIAYRVLGLKGNEDVTEIKKRYRKLVFSHHPDRLVSKGLAPEFLAKANAQFREIQSCYEEVCRQHNIS